ncbi:MAG: TlpA family protein disulfide reductase [Acidimicrobiales bacterium]
MSNRPKRTRSYGATRHEPGDQQRRVLVIAGIGVVVLVLIGIAVALAGESSSSDDRAHVAPISVSGDPLPAHTGEPADPAVGQPLPALLGINADQEQVEVVPGDGPTVVAVLAHWCPVCQREVPALVDLEAEGAFDGVRLVGLLTDSDRGRPNFPPAAWLEEEAWPGDVLLDSEELDAAQALGVSGYPFLVFLDADGNVVARTSGELPADTVRALLDEIR